MASTKLAFMPQDIIPPYSPETSSRISGVGNRSAIWSPAPQATPQTSSASVGSMWGSPLGVVPPAPVNGGSSVSLSSTRTANSPEAAPNSLAALSAESEPVLPGDSMPGKTLSDVHSFLTGSQTSSRTSSRHNSQTENGSPSLVSSGFPPSNGGQSSSGGPISRAVSPSSSSNSVYNLSLNDGTTATSSCGTSHVLGDEIINTAIVVKNIPFAVKKEQLIEFMVQLGLPLPYAFNYHFDNGVFRGLAFANFTSADETASVIAALNGRELGGRKLRVEYKKMLPFQERERIEREKRERRGQLEEQHQQGLNKKQSGAASPQLTVQAQTPRTQPSPSPLPPAQKQSSSSSSGSSSGNIPTVSIPPASISAGGISAGGIPTQRPLSSGRSHPKSAPSASLLGPSPSLLPQAHPLAGAAHSLQPPPLDMNIAENLQMFSSLLLFKKDNTKLELTIPSPQSASLSPVQIHALSVFCQQLGLQLYGSDEQGIVVAKKPDAASMFKADSDCDSYFSAGVFRNAIITPAAVTPSAYPLTRIGVQSLSTSSTNMNGMGAMNRWNLGNIANGGGGAATTSLTPK